MKNIYFSVLCLLLGPFSPLFADGFDRSESSQPAPPMPNDDRLPPVIPGQIVQNGDQKMRVWSSAGPVPVEQVPLAPQAGGVLTPGAVGVIIDDRKRPDYRTDRPGGHHHGDADSGHPPRGPGGGQHK